LAPSLRYASLSGYADVARSLGLDPVTLLRNAGLDVADLATPDKWVSAARVARLLELSTRTAGVENFGLQLAQHRRLATLGPLSLVLQAEADLRSALALLVRYEHTYNEALRIRVAEANGLATVRLWFEFGEPAPSRQGEELAVAALHAIIRELLGPGWQPLSVCFSHDAPRDPALHARVFGGRLRFGHAFSGLVFYARDLDTPITTATLGASADSALEALAKPKGANTSDRVRDLVEVLLPTGRCTADEVARALGVDRRTLHRHLGLGDETFTSIVDSMRAGLAERYLSNDRYRLTEISTLLGFSAPSAFTRWFRQHFGASPSQWRGRRALL
jgi:AraC-like DNA-binding protein